MTHPNLWDATKGVLRGMFRAVQAYLKKEEEQQKKPKLAEGKKS